VKVNGPPPRPRAAMDLLSNRAHRAPLPEPIKPTPGAPRPKFLTREAAAEWDRLEAELLRLGLLTTVDRAILAAYCEAWSTFVRATKALKKSMTTVAGNGTEIPHPAVAIQANAAERLRKLAPNFGFSPADRMRLLVASMDSDEQQKRDASYFGPRPAPAPTKAS
jgi:P27 family predicted phage terminase small subunit